MPNEYIRIRWDTIDTYEPNMKIIDFASKVKDTVEALIAEEPIVMLLQYDQPVLDLFQTVKRVVSSSNVPLLPPPPAQPIPQAMVPFQRNLL